LKGVDGIVFVADSQEPALDANVESFTNLKKNLEELNQSLEKTPFVFQYNKRDLRNILSVETLNRYLNREGFDVFEGAALHGVGVFETLKAISKKTLAAVHRKISGPAEAPSPAVTQAVSTVSAHPAAAKRAAGAVPASASSPSEATPSGTSEALFEELEDELDPQTVAIGSARSAAAAPPAPPAPPGTTRADTSTSEVRVEFAANRALGKEAAPAGGGSSSAKVTPVMTKSATDIEQELRKLRELAFGAAPPKKGEPPATSFVQGKGRAAVTTGALEKTSGVVVDLKLLGEGFSESVPGVLRVEMPPRQTGERVKLRLEIELTDSE
jgi:hypothetical protein